MFSILKIKLFCQKKNFLRCFQRFFLNIHYDDNFLLIQINFIINDKFVTKNFFDFNQNFNE